MLSLRVLKWLSVIFFVGSANLVVAAPLVKGWDDTITMGAISEGVNNTFNYNVLLERSVAVNEQAIFTYAKGGGGDSYSLYKYSTPNKTIALLEESREIEKVTGKRVMPVIVVYTAGGSSSDDAILVDLDQQPENYPDNLWLRYYNLIRISQVVQAAKDVNHPNPGTLVVNPDFLGEVHKSCAQYYCPIDVKNIKINIGAALTRAMSELVADKYLDAPISIPLQFQKTDASFADYLDSIDWLIKTVSPDVPFGWADNVWAGDQMAHKWLHQAYADPGLVQSHINDEAQYLKAFGFYDQNNPYRPDFIAFDKYERDNFDVSQLSYVLNNGYLYDASAWDVYFQYVGGVAEALNNMPLMLFQIPGGHLQTTNDIDARDTHASTAPSYIFGDKNLVPELANLKPYILETTLANPGNDYYFASDSAISYLLRCPSNAASDECVNGFYTWHASHMYQLEGANVFSILWGGGQTTSIAGLDADKDDNGWLLKKINEYYQSKAS